MIKADFETVTDITFPYPDDKYIILDLNSSEVAEGETYSESQTENGSSEVSISWHRLGVNPNDETISFARSATVDPQGNSTSDPQCEADDAWCKPGLDLFAFDASEKPTTTKWTAAKALLNWDKVNADGSNFDQLNTKIKD